MLGRDIRGRARVRTNTTYRRRVDNGTAFALRHHWLYFIFQAKRYSFQIDRHQPVPISFVKFGNWFVVWSNGGIVESHIQPAVSFYGKFHHVLYVFRFRNIRFYKRAFPSGSFNFFGLLPAFFFVEIGNYYFGSFAGKKFGCRSTHAHGAASNNRYFVL